MTPLDALARGLLAGVAGTALKTAYQELAGGGDSADPESWEDAPAPARVGRRVLKGVFRRDVPADRIPLLTHAMHWGYGTAWGAVYGVVQGTVRANPALHGLLFGTGVWAMSYVQLVPMGLYEPPGGTRRRPWRRTSRTTSSTASVWGRRSSCWTSVRRRSRGTPPAPRARVV